MYLRVILLAVSFEKFSVLMLYFFIYDLFCDIVSKMLPNHRLERFSVFSSRRCMVLDFTKPVVHF